MAKLFLSVGDNFTVSEPCTVFGSIGVETLKVSGVGVIADSNVDRVEFGGQVADYAYLVSGNLLSMLKAGSKVITLAMSDTTALAFTNGSADLVITKLNSVTLGGTALPTIAAAAVVPTIFDSTDQSSIVDPTLIGSTTAQTVVVNATHTTFIDSATVNTTYAITAGNYAATIAGFSNGDVLDFPAGTTATVSNFNYVVDGVVDLNWAISENMMSIHLTGLTATQDSQLFSVESFNSVFGAGSLI